MKQLILFAFAITCISAYAQENKPAEKKPLTLDVIWGGNYLDEQKLVVRKMNSGDSIAFIRADKATNSQVIVTLDFATGKLIDTIFTNQIRNEKDSSLVTFAFFEDFEMAPDDSKILIQTQIESLFYNSTRQFNYIWDRATTTLKPVSADGKQSYVSFSPDSKKIAFVREGNLFVKYLNNDQVIAITADGSAGKVLYGMADALYENCFGISKGYQWSPDGESIAFFRFNENVVQQYPITVYEGRTYPEIISQRYPKAGEAIPEVQVFIYSLRNKTLTKVDVGVNPNQYITGFKWQPDGNNLYVQRLNRPQTQLEILKANTRTGNTTIVFKEENKEYVKVFADNMFFMQTKNAFLWQSERSGYAQLYEVALNNFVVKPVTTGNWELQRIEGIDEENGEIYFTSNETAATEQNLYKCGLDGTGRQRITNGQGVHYTLLSASFNYFLDEYSLLNQPAIYQMYSTKGRAMHTTLVENKLLVQRLKEFTIPVTESFSFTSNGNNLNGWIIKPLAITRGRNPLLIYVYGGNTLQESLDAWKGKMGLTMRYLAAEGFMVVCIDPRGTPGKGQAFRNSNYKNIGDIEMSDLINLKKYAVANLKADSNAVSVIGWSYGGYLAALAATKYAGTFTNTIAIAPVTNWRFYENAYIERLLQLPAENPDGYKSSAAVNFVRNYNSGLLLIHGSADDNVHFQNSMEFSRELINANKQFQQYFFPDYAHAISSSGSSNTARINLFTKITAFMKEQLAQLDKPIVAETSKPVNNKKKK
ncbi:MAG: alpha/beta fold hydrolase [Sphingobacteriales bacterium]|nr:MAG: alpha/beta fold hydrolase [Sphingobacteriales bacterium]